MTENLFLQFPVSALILFVSCDMIIRKFHKKEGITTIKHTKKKTWNSLSAVLLILTVLSELVVAFALWKLQVLPLKFIALGAFGMVVITWLLSLLLFQKVGKWQKNVGHTKQVIGYVLCLILMVGCGAGTFAISKLNQTVSAITQPSTISTIFGVYVLAEDPAQTIEDTAGYHFTIVNAVEPEQTSLAAVEIETLLDGNLTIQNVESINVQLEGLYNGSVNAVILNQSYADILPEVEGYEDFNTRTRLIHEVSLIEEVEVTEPVEEEILPEETQETEPEIIEIDPTTMPFIMYLSGSDTRASVLVKSRSDVNILAVVNPVTKQILLVNTPRDYYVPNPAGNGEMDKLTHCGLYGIENSMKALGNLFGHRVSYYAQINFTGFKTLINCIGGVTVYSDAAFIAQEADFQVVYGNNHMDGEQALAFARERYNVSGGDIGRGKNQMKLIKAVVDKMTSSALLKNYSAILDSLQGMFTTNFTQEEITDVIKMQLDDMASWEVYTFALSGEGGSNTNFSMPGLNSYVMYPNETLVNKASDLMGMMLSGETITQDDLTVE